MVECHNCMKKGHIASNCCRYCKTVGHLIQNCLTRPPRSYQNRNRPRPNSSKSAPTTVAADEYLESSQSAFSITNIQSLLRQLIPSGNGNTPAALSTTPGNSKWYFDSAYCNQMTSASHLFSSLSKNDSTRSIHTADGSLMH
ncbi:zinc finger protein GIS2, partial [Trifolium pratense]